MRIVFWGTSDFAQPSLERIHQIGYEILYVITAPEKQAGRGLKLNPSPVRLLAEQLNFRILEPANPNTDDFYQRLSEETIDICVLAAYGFIIKPKLLKMPIKGFINIHPSLLPKYRGAAPIQRTIMNGEKETGVTTFFMNEAMDAGDIILQTKTDIDENETYDELKARLAKIGADLLISSLNSIIDTSFKPVPQDASKVILAPKIKKEHCLINWNQSSQSIHNLIRGLSSEPGAHTLFRNKRVRLIRSSKILFTYDSTAKINPGQIVTNKKDLVVATQDGFLQIIRLQLEGGKVITGTDFINGQRLQKDECFV